MLCGLNGRDFEQKEAKVAKKSWDENSEIAAPCLRGMIEGRKWKRDRHLFLHKRRSLCVFQINILRAEFLQPAGVCQGEGHQVLGEELAKAALERGTFAEGGDEVGAACGGSPEQRRHGVEAV